jgi:hypothetical protein
MSAITDFPEAIPPVRATVNISMLPSKIGKKRTQESYYVEEISFVAGWIEFSAKYILTVSLF